MLVSSYKDDQVYVSVGANLQKARPLAVGFVKGKAGRDSGIVVFNDIIDRDLR
jgi:hypothetical protein